MMYSIFFLFFFFIFLFTMHAFNYAFYCILLFYGYKKKVIHQDEWHLKYTLPQTDLNKGSNVSIYVWEFVSTCFLSVLIYAVGWLFCEIWLVNNTNNNRTQVNNRNTRKRCEICLKLAIKAPERRKWRLLMLFMLTLNIFQTFF